MPEGVNMPTDLQIIAQLEKEIGKKLNWIVHDEITCLLTNGYATDDNKNIVELALYNINRISDISVLNELTNLTLLELSGNRISDISVLKDLKNLTTLYLGHNQISDISVLKDLKNLTLLYLSDNQILDISVLNDLKNLNSLYLCHNQISDISGLKDLKNLTTLDLSDNRISDLSGLKDLENLTTLDLRNNQITQLPSEIVDMEMGIKWDGNSGIILANNPLESPPIEIVKKGRSAVKAYFKSLEGEKQALNEVKVLLVGDGGAGKTSLVKQLLGENFDEHESQTHGINIRDWKVEEQDISISVHFWDFGGQEIMHATHQFFLSKRSLYILVLDGRKDEKTEYWLKHIESFGGDSPVLVVINKIDENPGFDVNRRFLQEKYKGIQNFYRVSCAKREGINGFAEGLSKALADVELIQTTWATSWFNVKTQLENMTDYFISYEQYEEMCAKENITEKSAQDTLVDFLNDLGVILHFKDFELLDTHVLDPKWVTEAVYKIINSKRLAECNGVLRLDLLGEILKKEKETDYSYPPDKYRFIIDLMKKFELCYEIDNHTVLIPDLLEVQEPKIDFHYAKSLKFVIDYDFLPKSVMPRFIVKMNKDIKNELRWRTGVVLEDKAFHSTAVIKADEQAEKIYIYVNGEQKRDYFSVILFTFREINRTFEKLEAIEKVPMPDEPEITVSYEHLIRLEKKGVEKYIPDGSENEYIVKKLLGTIYVENKTEEEILQILRALKDKSDTEETLRQKANDVIMLKPNVMGVGIDLNSLIKKVFDKEKRK
jgi:small GTP-binding protein